MITLGNVIRDKQNRQFSTNRFELFNAMINRREVQLLTTHDGWVSGWIIAMELEDGSGHCFNVTLQTGDASRKTIFVRG